MDDLELVVARQEGHVDEVLGRKLAVDEAGGSAVRRPGEALQTARHQAARQDPVRRTVGGRIWREWLGGFGVERWGKVGGWGCL